MSFQVIRENIPESQVKTLVKRIDQQGKREGLPFSEEEYDLLYTQKGPYTLLWVPLQTLDSIPSRDIKRIKEYAGRKTEFPPINLRYGKRSAKKKKTTLTVMNGNHRVEAAKLRGDRKIQALIPTEDWILFQENFIR